MGIFAKKCRDKMFKSSTLAPGPVAQKFGRAPQGPSYAIGQLLFYLLCVSILKLHQ